MAEGRKLIPANISTTILPPSPSCKHCSQAHMQQFWGRPQPSGACTPAQCAQPAAGPCGAQQCVFWSTLEPSTQTLSFGAGSHLEKHRKEGVLIQVNPSEAGSHPCITEHGSISGGDTKPCSLGELEIFAMSMVNSHPQHTADVRSIQRKAQRRMPGPVLSLHPQEQPQCLSPHFPDAAPLLLFRDHFLCLLCPQMLCYAIPLPGQCLAI